MITGFLYPEHLARLGTTCRALRVFSQNPEVQKIALLNERDQHHLPSSAPTPTTAEETHAALTVYQMQHFFKVFRNEHKVPSSELARQLFSLATYWPEKEDCCLWVTSLPIRPGDSLPMINEAARDILMWDLSQNKTKKFFSVRELTENRTKLIQILELLTSNTGMTPASHQLLILDISKQALIEEINEGATEDRPLNTEAAFRTVLKNIFAIFKESEKPLPVHYIPKDNKFKPGPRSEYLVYLPGKNDLLPKAAP